MIRNRKGFIAAALCTVAFGQAWAQAPQAANLDIEWENAVGYIEDLGDPSKLATSPGVLTANIRNFMPFIAIADIISVNGKPAKGSWVLGGRIIQLVPSPAPGQAIGDLGRGALVDVHFEILQRDGTRIGSIMTSGFTGGPAPPGSPSGLFLNLAVTGGTGAFLGATGTVTSPSYSNRPTSIAEDPANRRTNGGTRGHFIVSVIPRSRPEIMSIASGPAVVHASDFSLVTAAKPAQSGEVLTLYASGLGATRPSLEPGKVFASDPLQVANSPIEVTVGGQAAEVLYAGGYPGTTDGFQVDFRMPSGVAPGMASLQLTAAFIQSREVSLSIQ